MKICILPGVGFHDKTRPEYFIKTLQDHLPDATIEFFDWKTGYIPPPIPYEQGCFTRYVRKQLTEILFDAEYVLLHGTSMPIPPADVYIGHSAGSIAALMRGEGKMVVTMGSPASLIEGLQSLALCDKMGLSRASINRKVFNVVNQMDVISYPINNPSVVNWTYSSGIKFYMPLFGPHSDYWFNEKVIDEIAKAINEYVIPSV